MAETCLLGMETLSWFPEDIDDIPGTWHLLRFIWNIYFIQIYGSRISHRYSTPRSKERISRFAMCLL